MGTPSLPTFLKSYWLTPVNAWPVVAKYANACKYWQAEIQYKCGAHDNYVRIWYWTPLSWWNRIRAAKMAAAKHHSKNQTVIQRNKRHGKRKLEQHQPVKGSAGSSAFRNIRHSERGSFVSYEDRNFVTSNVDIAHRVGRPNVDSGKGKKPRPVIIRFTSRTAQDLTWKGAKGNDFLKKNKMYFKEDLTVKDRATRNLLRPSIDKARKEGKRAFFVGIKAMVEGKKLRFKSVLSLIWGLNLNYCNTETLLN